MSALTSPLPDRSGDMLRLFPRLVAYARGLGCSEEVAPALVRAVALEAIEAPAHGASLEEIEASLRAEIGIRCLRDDPVAEDCPQGGSSCDYMEGIRAAQKELQLNFEALDRIDPTLRRIFVLRAINHLGFGEIAKALGLPIRSVKSRVQRAMREVAAMRQGAPAILRLSPTSARPASASRSKTPPGVSPRAGAGKTGKPPRLPLPAPGLRVVNGGKKWDGPKMV